MKAVVQRVKSAKVAVKGRVVNRIGKGMLILVGIAKKDGVIKGYSVLLDPDALQKYVFCLQISVKPQSNLDQICPKIADFGDVSIIMRVSGDCDLLVLAVCEHQKGALDLISKISGIQGIEKVESHIVLETIKMTAKWFKLKKP